MIPLICQLGNAVQKHVISRILLGHPNHLFSHWTEGHPNHLFALDRILPLPSGKWSSLRLWISALPFIKNIRLTFLAIHIRI
jgi:hypothetical protein